MGVKWYLIVVSMSISLMTNNVEHLLICWLPFVCVLLRNVISTLLPVLNWVVVVVVRLYRVKYLNVINQISKLLNKVCCRLLP